MDHPNLYRAGNTTSARFDNLRPQDIDVDKDGFVNPGGDGGISTFSNKRAEWPDRTTWVLKSSTPLVPGLIASKDLRVDGHWLIQPSQRMKRDAYVDHLKDLNSKAVRYDRLPPKEVVEAESEVSVLAAQSANADRATRFVYNALAAVVHKRVPVDEWDENDYEYIALLARALEDGTLELSALLWGPEGEAAEWKRAKAFTASAVAAYMAQEAVRVKASGNEDDESDMANDHAYLHALLKLDDAENPFSTVVASPAA
ncbi:hypothetical protein BD311DRAFT_778598 [Dichomitus squalens]|nr:hypothetical protein BD311DRAFT_778598 [Dichomitus squalens]